MKGTLTKDIESTAVRGRMYGLKGDVVTVISNHVNVLIVEDSVGNRYPVKRDLIKIKDSTHETT